MEFRKIKNTLFIAEGKFGKFIVEKSRGVWWGKFEGPAYSFRFPPKRTLKEAKEICKNNHYWE